MWDNEFAFSKYTRVNATEAEIEKYSLLKGDFLFNTRNSYELVGKTCIFEGANERDILFNNNIMRIRFTKNIISHFINYAFSARIIINKIKHFKSGTTNVSAIYYKDLRNLIIPIPSLTEQKSIVVKLDALSAETKKLETIYKQKLVDLEEIKNQCSKRLLVGDYSLTMFAFIDIK
ncbi:MAG: restriction endonuclease subunit S [bacterium]|nr:restriction endonuclease subunit S [bacterium]